jgi:hypothetical protein
MRVVMVMSINTGTPVPFELNPVLGILIGVVAVLLVVAIVIVGALRVRAQNRGNSSRPGDLALKEKAALPLRSNVEDLYEMDDKNPDVIPCNKGKRGFCNIKCFPGTLLCSCSVSYIQPTSCTV